MTPLRPFKTIGLVVSIVALSLSGVMAAPTLTARVSREIVRDGETVDLLLRYSGGYPQEAPHLEGLSGDFEIIESRHGRQTTIVNGRSESSFDWIVTLLPRSVGALTIPAIRAGAVASLPIALTVLDGGAPDAPGDAPDLFVEAEVEDESPFVQGEARYTVRVFDAIGMIEGSLTEPGADNLRVEALGEDRHYETVVDGRPYRVYERTYILFPQTSGTISIPPVVLEATVPDRRTSRRRTFGGSPFDDLFGDPFAGFGTSLFDRIANRGRSVRVRSDEVTLDVRPRPEGVGDRWFLPARKVELIEKWNPETPTFRVGEPVTRTVAIRALGAASEQLPELDIPAAPGTRQYPDGATDETVATEDGMVSVLQQSIAIVPTESGSVTLPPVEVEWWDIAADEARVATLPAREIEILAAEADSATVGAPGEPSDASPAADSGVLTATLPATWSRLIVVVSMVVLLSTLALLARGKLRSSRPVAESPASTVRAVRRACAGGDPAAARDALLRWARAKWPAEPPSTPGAIAARLGEPRVTEAIDSLDRALYAREGANVWDGTELRRAFDDARSRRTDSRREPTPVLPALYPNTPRSS